MPRIGVNKTLRNARKLFHLSSRCESHESQPEGRISLGGARRTARMSFAHRSVLKEMREKKAKAAKAVERAVSRWRPWAESASSEPAPWPAKFGKGGRGITRGVPQVPEDNRWRLGKYAVRADFDGGNLRRVEQNGADGAFQLWTRSDCEGSDHATQHRTWFHFRIEGHSPGETLSFTVMNYVKQGKIFQHDYRPVYRQHPSGAKYARCNQSVSHWKTDQGQFRWTFRHKVETAEPTYFAFTFPFSHGDCVATLDAIDARFASDKTLRERVYVRRQTLARSLEGRDVDVLTVTAPAGVSESEYDEAPVLSSRVAPPGRAPEDRPIFIVSAGVHPGEKPGNHMMCGIIEFLLRPDDPRASALRERFVFKLVPMLNPDGAFRGHFRQDTLGQNLNRFYDDPDPTKQPVIHAVVAMAMHYANRRGLGFYVDLHGHMNKRGVFAFGNALEGEDAASGRAYARLCSLNTPHFDVHACNFTEKNMRTEDKNGQTKEGSGRVALHAKTGLPHLYTVEANYVSSRLLARVPPASGDDGRASPPSRSLHPVKYTPEVLNDVGRALMIAALDLQGEGANPWSRLPGSEYGSLEGLLGWARSAARGDAGKRGDVTVAVSKKWRTVKCKVMEFTGK